jgi:hypothetical protein
MCETISQCTELRPQSKANSVGIASELLVRR